MPSAAADVGGILATIDQALAGDTSGDSMRWTPPTVTLTFIWDEDDEVNGSAMFTGVDMMAAESLQPGQPVTVDGKRYVIVAKLDTDQGLVIELS